MTVVGVTVEAVRGAASDHESQEVTVWWYVGKRLLQTIPVFLGATLIIYLLLFFRPGDPILNLFGNKPVSEAVATRSRLSTTSTTRCSSSGCTS